MQFYTQDRRWRWLALAVVAANVAFNYLTQGLPLGEGSIEAVSARYDSLFTPAGYAFAIWGLIHAATIAYVVHQLLPSQRNADAHDRLSRPLIVLNVLAMAWIAVFRFGMITVSVLVIIAMLGTSVLYFVRAREAAVRRELSRWTVLPATLWFAWLSVAVIANASLWAVAMDWTGGIQVEWTLAMIAIATLLGIGVGYRYSSWIYPLVIAWAGVAIWVERSADFRGIATAALASAAVMVAWSVLCALRARRDRSGFRIFHGPMELR
ncbi:MAG TPA: hypothetical protein VHA15_08920 [Burkholderiales bacterium]|jgi:hypothetical protein|nr:hypothetical protein [Burkholderiales bacterium]